VPLAGIDSNAVRNLADRISTICPELNSRWLARIDSPRSPRDLDCRNGRFAFRALPPRRQIDSQLRKSILGSSIRLSMFPTPPLGYFRSKSLEPACKAHLRAIYDALFCDLEVVSIPGGGTFTRFMLSGFACFRALELLGVKTYESFPDLEFRLANGGALTPKRTRRLALDHRRLIIRSLRLKLRIDGPSQLTMDQADAEVLALTGALASRERKLLVLANKAEGNFIVTAAA